jgi:hypothetical protein
MDRIRMTEYLDLDVETEYLPPGHPITHDMELDIDSLKARLAKGEYVIRDSRLVLLEVEA